MRRTSKKSGTDEGSVPLVSIAGVIAVMLLLPTVLYSVAPEGPMREGDTVFAKGRQVANFPAHEQRRKAGYEKSCVLEPKDPLIVVEKPPSRPEGFFLAQVQGKTAIEVPFCPPQAKILVKPAQVIQKLSLWQEFKERMAYLVR